MCANPPKPSPGGIVLCNTPALYVEVVPDHPGIAQELEDWCNQTTLPAACMPESEFLKGQAATAAPKEEGRLNYTTKQTLPRCRTAVLTLAATNRSLGDECG
jgi:hypothetical protein